MPRPCPSRELEKALAAGLQVEEVLDLLCEQLARFKSLVDRRNWDRLSMAERAARVKAALDRMESKRVVRH
ncbi:hypothetical protein GCM10007036_31190 [Alsobacter metallidurans]|uniref:Uncharacterized protein n=1 Tax=Alsobacter metallidurans TaxID=340221 RepID=A0A917I9Y4_9HYPH|nr:hypothetical protein GCM10007036_31190 [Alsobacter metallidurans]